ncbi:MAG: phosphohydrolase [Clostridiales bacterium]|jgi:HD-GYP domain-containing protein (c-di-GMP phosphodiesterase class II)|nr:phosphohydrolase [Clostridiales bacterium]
MRKVMVSNIKENEVLAKCIFDNGGRILLSEGVKLSRAYIERLVSMGIDYVFIEDEISKGIQPEEVILDETRQEGKTAIKKTLQKYINHGSINTDAISKCSNNIIEEILSQKDVLINITEIRSKDEGIYGHSVNVCALAVIIGTYLGYNMLRLKDVAVGAMMHDFGKMVVINEMTKKGERNVTLSNSEVVQKHPRAGYEFLGKQSSISVMSKVMVLMHHENCDGTGFPLGLKKNEIHEVARLLSICDTFDNLVSGNEDMKPMPVYQAIEYLTAMSGSKYDGEIVKQFVENIAVYPTGVGVRMNTGEKGIVCSQNRSFPTRPVVRLVFDRDGEVLPDTIEVDLSKDLTFFIQETCEL